MRPVHFVSISGGKDSTATACLAIDRAQRRDMELRFLFADTGNEHELTLEYVAYLGSALGVEIETVRADFSRLFERRRETMRRDWARELRRKTHSRACMAAQRESLSRAEKILFREGCDCPVKVSPALPADLIERAVELMQPSGNSFLDMAMLHGRFPSSQARFCTKETKLDPMNEIKDRVRIGGRAIVEWIGERAEESPARARKPVLERRRCLFRSDVVFYRPIHGLSARETFEIAKRRGIKPNPLYLMGMSRVGCMPCIMCGKGELREIARRFPEHIERIAEWEAIVGAVARRNYTALANGTGGEMTMSFLSSDKVPDGGGGLKRAAIERAAEWSRTGRGGRNFDLLNAIDDLDAIEEPNRCSSEYGLCE